MRLQLRAQALQLRLDEPALQLGRPKGERVRPFGAAPHLLCIAPRERNASEHGVNRQVRIQAIEIEVAEVVRQCSAKEP